MKVFQNSYHGVLMAIPSPRFFKNFLLSLTEETNRYAMYCKANLLDIVTHVNDWTDYFDVYDAKYVNMYLQFDSWQELFNIIMTDDMSNLKQKYLKIMDEKMSQHRKEMDQKWTEFFTNF